MKIYNGHKRLSRNYSLLADAYEFTMTDGYLYNGKQNQEVVFDGFFRKVPNNGGFSVMAGLDKVIEYIQNLKFSEQELNYFIRNGVDGEYLNYLKNFRFTGDIYAIPDGTPVFPNEPLITVRAPLNEAQIIETMLLNLINGAMEHATGARRIIEAAHGKPVNILEFGARRADGPEAAIDASIYGIMAGCKATSNCLAADMLNMKAFGTMAHSWIESYPTELEAFMAFAKFVAARSNYMDSCTLLVDTIDTLKSGIPNAIKTFKFIRENNLPIKNIGVRLDSGELVILSNEVRRMQNQAGFSEASICLSNGLGAEGVETLIKQGADFDTLGIGDNISKPAGRMGCVYKEVAINEKGILIPKIKLSNDIIKITNPDYKKLYRAYDKETGFAVADIITTKDKKIKKENLTVYNLKNNLNKESINNFELLELQKPIFINGNLVYDDPEILERQKFCNSQMSTINPEVKKVRDPFEYSVTGTEDYVNSKNKLINDTLKLVRK